MNDEKSGYVEVESEAMVAEAKRVYKQVYDHEWKKVLVNVYPPLNTPAKHFEYIKMMCTGLQHSVRDRLNSKSDGFVSASEDITYPTTVCSDGDKALVLVNLLAEISLVLVNQLAEIFMSFSENGEIKSQLLKFVN